MGFVERAGRSNQCKCTTGNVFCVGESDSVTAPVIPSIRVTGEEEETGSKINFPEERRAAAGVRSSRRGSEALLRIVEEASQASQCSQAGVTRGRGVQANLALIKPLSGDVHQVLESCGDNCSVLMERPSDFFNQF